ncbi:MAG: HAMP domain-containing histidine kinase, partial [Pseudobdellovibrionaceae bacterium]|nr:HAMP domain-containing histidine kinase [Pseudobdellovibrionaceae bacterium]
CMLIDFLQKHEKEILALTEQKTRDLAGAGSSSKQLEQGLPIFYKQLMAVLQLEPDILPQTCLEKDKMAKAALEGDEPALAAASGRHREVELAKTAGLHGAELLRLGYTLSHVVHAYGSMCQAINEIAVAENFAISPDEFRSLNQCLDVAIAGAVTEFASKRAAEISNREVEHLGFLAHELRNALNTVTMAFQLIEDGVVTPRGSTGQALKRGLVRLDDLIARSLTEVRLRVDPKVDIQSAHLLQLVDQIALTARIETKSRNQTLEISVSPDLEIEADQQLMHSALTNLIQNAIKFTRMGGRIQVRGDLGEEGIVIEVEDECGGLSPHAEAGLFKPFGQYSENRKGLGLGLTIVQRAIGLNHGTIECKNLPGKGCIFRMTVPHRV